MPRSLGKLAVMELRAAHRDTLRGSSPMAPNSQAVLALESSRISPGVSDPPSDECPPLPLPMHLLSSACSKSAQRNGAQVLPGFRTFWPPEPLTARRQSPERRKARGRFAPAFTALTLQAGRFCVRDERENQPPTQGSAVGSSRSGLISGGEFGTTLGMILADTARGQISWSHWERTARGCRSLPVLGAQIRLALRNHQLTSASGAIEGIATSPGAREAFPASEHAENNPSRTSHLQAGSTAPFWIRHRGRSHAFDGSRFERHLPVPSRRLLVEYGPVQMAAASLSARCAASRFPSADQGADQRCIREEGNVHHGCRRS